MVSTSSTGRWLLVGFEKVVDALLDLRHLFLPPSLALKGVDFGCDADLSSEHPSDFASDPSWGAADPGVHEDVTVLGRRCSGLEMVEEGLLCAENLNGAGRETGQTSTSVGFDAQASGQQRADQGSD